MKCYICGKETNYKSYLLKVAFVKDAKKDKNIECLCWECENEVIKMWKKQWENEK